MALQECGLYRGFVYKKIPESTKTFAFFKTVNDYVMSILDNAEVIEVHSKCTSIFKFRLPIKILFKRDFHDIVFDIKRRYDLSLSDDINIG